MLSSTTRMTPAEFDAALDASHTNISEAVELSRYFIRELMFARGRICTPERQSALYKIIHEINVETDETNEYWEKFEAFERLREREAQERKGVAVE